MPFKRDWADFWFQSMLFMCSLLVLEISECQMQGSGAMKQVSFLECFLQHRVGHWDTCTFGLIQWGSSYVCSSMQFRFAKLKYHKRKSTYCMLIIVWTKLGPSVLCRRCYEGHPGLTDPCKIGPKIRLFGTFNGQWAVKGKGVCNKPSLLWLVFTITRCILLIQILMSQSYWIFLFIVPDNCFLLGCLLNL